MRSLSIEEGSAVLPDLERLLEREGELLVTRDGQPIARLLPVESRRPIPSHAELRSRMRRLEIGSEVLIRQDRDGR